MIDIENDVVDAVAEALSTDYPDMPVYSVTVLSPEVFPCVSIEESDNYVDTRSSSLSVVENACHVMYSVNVFSNIANGKKAQAKAIYSIIDTTLAGLGFTREYTNPVNIDSGTAYRLTGRYTKLVAK